jgi:hypothetical protein
MTPADFFAAYDGFGERRAGGRGDADSAAWLRDLAQGAGATAWLIPVPFGRFVPGPSQLDAEGRTVEGMPLFDGGLTDSGGVVGTIGPLGSAARIGFVAMEPQAASLPGNDFARARAESRHAAILVALRTRPDSIAPLNAHDLAAPFGPPVLQVPGREAEWITGLAARGAPARVAVTGRHGGNGRSANVRAELSGAAPPLLLLTPRTSWWTSTAERAGGVLCWLAALEALAKAPRARGVVGLATCGHEIGHIGARRAFAAEPALAERAMVIHLGANLGCAEAPRLTVRSNVEGLAARMTALLVAAGHPPDPIQTLTGGKANGEAHEIESRGGRYLSLIGENPWFHAAEDRWPISVDLPRAEAIARAVAAMAVELAA